MEELKNPCIGCANCLDINRNCKLFGYALSKCDKYMDYTIQQDALTDWESYMQEELEAKKEAERLMMEEYEQYMSDLKNGILPYWERDDYWAVDDDDCNTDDY